MSGDRFFLQLRHYAGPPVVNAGAAKVAQCDADGNLLVAGTFAPAPPVPPAAPTTDVANTDVPAANVVPAACRVYQYNASNENSYALWILLIDLATEPGDDDQAIWSRLVPAGESVSEAFSSPLGLSNGLSYAWSLTPHYTTLPVTFTGSSASFATF